MFLNIFKRKKCNPVPQKFTEEELKWNRMWELWTNGEIETPYNELMTYQSEIHNGGHSQYFTLLDDNSDTETEISLLCSILPDILNENVRKAYRAYLILEENETDEVAESIIKRCDETFFENEQMITDILEAYAEKL